MGVPPLDRTGGLSHHNALSINGTPLRCLVAARAAILCPYDTHFYDVIGLSAFSSLSLIGFCWTVDG